MAGKNFKFYDGELPGELADFIGNGPESDPGCKTKFSRWLMVYKESLLQGKLAIPQSYVAGLCGTTQQEISGYISYLKDKGHLVVTDCNFEIGKKAKVYTASGGLRQSLLPVIAKEASLYQKSKYWFLVESKLLSLVYWC